MEISNIYLMNGTWLEALDLLRSKADSCGEELDTLEEEEAWYVQSEFRKEHWDELHQLTQHSAVLAQPLSTVYIRGADIPFTLLGSAAVILGKPKFLYEKALRTRKTTQEGTVELLLCGLTDRKMSGHNARVEYEFLVASDSGG